MDLKFIINIITLKFKTTIAKIRTFASLSKLKMLFQGTFIKFFQKLSDVKPKSQKDYYNVFAWQISKKVAYLVVVIIGVLSAVYVINLASTYIASRMGDGIKVYKYDSTLLKFQTGTVKIKAKSGYIAYVGDVDKGYCEGTGSLYRKDGSLVYEGDFSSSMFNGSGDSYYSNGNKEYTGEFVNNLFDGEGTLYRENNSTEYVGNFSEGLKDGEGVLYNNGGTEVFAGIFSKDHIVFSELLGGTTEDVAAQYTGESSVYMQDTEFVNYMSEIGAAYLGSTNEDALDDSATVSTVYVLDDTFNYGSQSLTSVDQLKEALDLPTYEGNAYVNLGEAVCINILNNQRGNALSGPVSMDMSEVLENYNTVDAYDDSYMVYLYVYEKDGLVYTFVAPDKGEDFEFYYIQTQDTSGAETADAGE